MTAPVVRLTHPDGIPTRRRRPTPRPAAHTGNKTVTRTVTLLPGRTVTLTRPAGTGRSSVYDAADGTRIEKTELPYSGCEWVATRNGQFVTSALGLGLVVARLVNRHHLPLDQPTGSDAA